MRAKPVSQAFLTALESIPEASQAAVGKAALAMIRDDLKTMRDKAKAAAAKEKARKPAVAKATALTVKKPAKTKAKKRVVAKKSPGQGSGSA